MDFLKDRRIALVLGGAAVALLAGLAIAWTLISSHRGEASAPPPASRGGLVIDSSDIADARMDPHQAAALLRGRTACGRTDTRRMRQAKRRLDRRPGRRRRPDRRPGRRGPRRRHADAAGAASGRRFGGAAAGSPAGAGRRRPAADRQRIGGRLLALRGRAVAQAAQRHGPWRCAQTLFAGRCERAGEAAYGRWQQQTLRLVPAGWRSPPTTTASARWSTSRAARAG